MYSDIKSDMDSHSAIHERQARAHGCAKCMSSQHRVPQSIFCAPVLDSCFPLRLKQYRLSKNWANKTKYDAYMPSAAVKFGTCPSQCRSLPYSSLCKCVHVMKIPTAICPSCNIVTIRAHFGGVLQTAARK
mmetsp:Transcript_31893/g.67811  ORF Transcript_31893/g.67811 Transcript_31893/m.67811 type:complete len:131 (+) Transcript_31893:87-479(+)